MSVINETQVSLKSIADISEMNVSFFIDAYQRGYRWTPIEVRDLLEDVREFSHSKKDEKSFYCLQPIIVTKNDNGAYKVIDGQQRLTTIFLIYVFYRAIASRFAPEVMPFELHYNGKERLETCLNELLEKSYGDAVSVDENMSDYESDIDCHYILDAYKYVCDYFQNLYKDVHIRGDVNEIKKILDNGLKVIWYEILNCDQQKEIDVFTKINMGKIPLTNAELIKALLLRKNADLSKDLESTQMNISVKWDEIESKLMEKSFWSFLVNDREHRYATRIDFIFQVMARDINDRILKNADEEYPNEERFTVDFEGVNKDKYAFYVFSNYVRYLEKDKSVGYVKCIWDEVCEYYRMFKDWFQNVHWYHKIGLIVCCAESDNIDVILKLSKLYRNEHDQGIGHKRYFEQQLIAEVKQLIFGDEKADESDIESCVESLDYDNSDGVRKVLLLYNIAWLELCKENGRFPFEKYKDEEISWDIEHINAVADGMPTNGRNDSEDNDRLIWLKNLKVLPELNEICLEDGRNAATLLSDIESKKLYLDKNQPGADDFKKLYEAVIKYFEDFEGTDNSIANLTLLDSGTNRSYRNAVFPIKRQTILENSMKDVFIPLCTKKVFMKAFVGSKNLLRWHSDDKDAYKKDLIDCISKYLSEVL